MARDVNFWVLVGNSGFSETQWGIARSNFPMAYLMPEMAVHFDKDYLARPQTTSRTTLFAGLTFEIGKPCRSVTESTAGELIQACRLWIGLHTDTLLHSLNHLGHQVRLRDQGISVYYGQWHHHCHLVGEQRDYSLLQDRTDDLLSLKSSSGKEASACPKDYSLQPEAIVSFMSRFMTLNKGDCFSLGALCGFQLDPEDSNISVNWKDVDLHASLRPDADPLEI